MPDAPAAITPSSNEAPSLRAERAPPPIAPPEPVGPPRCLELGNPERALVFNWERAAHVEAAEASKLRSLTGAGAELRALSQDIELELKNACTRIAADLDEKTGPFGDLTSACRAAESALNATRAKLGASAKTTLSVHPSVCLQSSELAAECIKSCDGREGAISCSGGASGGRCTGKCTGRCEGRPPGKCEGLCSGTCESGFSGTCEGICTGTCDGKDMKVGGSCKGKCEGRCQGEGKGTCAGGCLGGCTLDGGVCEGQCVGDCSERVQGLQCAGDLVPAQKSAACDSYCGARQVRRTQCTRAVVNVLITGAKDEQLARTLSQSLERQLPALLKLEQQLKGRKDELDRAKRTIDTELAEAKKKAKQAPYDTILPCLDKYGAAATEALSLIATAERSLGQVSQAAQRK